MSAATVPAASAARHDATTARAIPADRARSLARWNRFLAVAHLAQFILMVAVSRTTSLFEPVVPTIKPLFTNGKFSGVEPTEVVLMSVPLAYVIASFFLMSSIAHVAAGWVLRDRYEGWLARGLNPLRWVEYAFSSTVMIVAIAYISYIPQFTALVAIATCNAAMNLFGWSMEAANEGRSRIQWLHYIFGCFAGAIPWIVIFIALITASTAPNATGIPGFVIAIFISLFVSFNVFAINMVLQYRKIGRWADYLYGERAYMILSLVAKTLLAWQVFSGTLRP